MKPEKRSPGSAALLDSPQVAALFEKARAAAEGRAADPTIGVQAPPPMPVPERRMVRWRRASAFGLFLACLATWWCYGGSRSAALRMALPGGINGANPVTAELCLLHGDFHRAENLEPLRQLGLIKGNHSQPTQSVTIHDPHLAYAVLGNLFTIALNAYEAFWSANLALYLGCALLVARTARALFDDWAKAQLAAALFVLSIAGTVQVGNLSPHLLGIAFYFLWTHLLLRIDVGDRPIEWGQTIGLSALLGVWTLADSSALFGLVVYVLYLLKREKLIQVALPVAAWYALPQLQRLVAIKFGCEWPAEVAAAAFWQALEIHWKHLSHAPLNYLGYLTVELGNYLFNDNPLDVVIGVVVLLVLRHRAKWLLWTCYLVPIAVCFLGFTTTTARGSIVAGNAIVLLPIVAHCVIDVSRQIRREFGFKMAAMPIVLIIGLQAAWGHATQFGWLYPVNAFATGLFKNSGALLETEFVPMSGPAVERPTAVGGDVPATGYLGLPADFGKLCVVPERRLAPYKDHWAGLPAMEASLAIQGPVLACLILASCFLVRVRRNLLVMPLAVGCISGAQLCGAVAGTELETARLFDDRIAIKEDEKLTAQIQLSNEFRRELEAAAKQNVQVEFAIPVRGTDAGNKRPFEFQIGEWSSDAGRITASAHAFLAALEAHRGRIEFSISPKAGTKELYVHSWRKLESVGGQVAASSKNDRREAWIIRADGSQEPIEWFPSFEIRVVRGEGDYPFSTWFERFDGSRPTGYVLVGF